VSADGVSELCRLNSPQDVQHYIAQRPEIATSEIVEQLADTVRQYVRVDVGYALKAGEAACAIAEVVADRSSMGRALRAKANALWFKGQCKPALELLQRALNLFEDAGRDDEVGRTLSTSIQPLILLGEYKQALENAAKARDIFVQQGDELRLARLELNVANIYLRQENFAEALSTYERAYERLLPFGDTEAIAVALHNMPVCLIGLDDFDRAMKVYLEGQEFFERHAMPAVAAQADYNIAYLYYLRGDYERALAGLNASRKSCAQNGDDYHVALCDLDQSEIYLDLNLTEEAAQMAESAAGQFEDLGMGYERARSIVNLAIATTRKGDTKNALSVFRQAKSVFVQEGHRSGEALVDLYEAVLLFELGEYRSAKRLSLSSSQFFRSSGLIRKAVVAELLLSHLALAEGNPGVARSCCDEALRLLGPLQAPSLTCQALLLSGRIYEAAGAQTAAFDTYEAARLELESVRSGLQGEELKIAFMTNKIEVYQRLVGLCLQRGCTGVFGSKALTYMELAKSQSLLDTLSGRAQPLPAHIAGSAQAAAEIGAIRGHLNWCYHRIDAEQLRPGGVARDNIEHLWEQAREYENRLLNALRHLPAECAEVRRLDGPPITLDHIRESLDTETTLIEYFEVGDEMVAAILKMDSLNVVSLAKKSRVKSTLRMLQLQLSKFRFDASSRKGLEVQLAAATLRHLQRLYKQLVAPLRPFIGGSHLVFVPHGILHYLPIHALHDGDSFLIDQFTISSAPSASLYVVSQRRTTAPGNSKALILGVQDDNAPWILNEAREVASVFPNAILLMGAHASHEALQEFAPDSRLIHIATHGYFRRDNPMFSAVRLAESYLSVYDLYKLHIPVDLLTLSGCGTGLNVVAPGDELIGLSRGLLYAGAKALLLSLWDVHDRSTAEFMCAFYTHWSANSSKAAALRAAMMEVRDRYPHPYYWAPFTLIGNAH
jgi:CHAT domain-containing protein